MWRKKITKIEFFGTQIIDHNIVLDVSIVIPVVIEMVLVFDV